MSIVYDYLKQVKSRTDLHEQEMDHYPAALNPPPAHSSSLPRWAGWVVGGFLAAAVLGTVIFLFSARTGQPAKAADKPPRAAQTVQPDVRQTQFGYVLEGIIFNPVKPFAIINGSMLEVGGQIGDTEVTSITPDTVLLKDVKLNRDFSLKL